MVTKANEVYMNENEKRKRLLPFFLFFLSFL